MSILLGDKNVPDYPKQLKDFLKADKSKYTNKDVEEALRQSYNDLFSEKMLEHFHPRFEFDRMLFEAFCEVTGRNSIHADELAYLRKHVINQLSKENNETN